MDAGLEAKLRELLVKREIEELLYERARALDRHDHEGQLRAFTDDATVTHEGWHGTFREFLATRSGTAAWRNKVGRIGAHFICDVLVFLDDDTHARSHCYHLATGTMRETPDGPSTDRIVVGRYFDWLVLTADGWRISHRDVVFDWSTVLPPSERVWASNVGSPHMLVGTTDHTDPFYARFGSTTPQTNAMIPVGRRIRVADVHRRSG